MGKYKHVVMTVGMSDERLAEIRARANAATPGPWLDDVTSEGMLRIDLRGDGRKTGYADVIDVADMEVSAWQDHQNAAFIANARTDIPDMLAEIQRLRTKLFLIDQVYPGLSERVNW
jgi:hypothetical protein